MFDRLVSLFSRVGLIIGSILLAVMMLLTVFDVFMRYVFLKPVFGGAEMTQILLSVIVFAGFIAVSRDGSHIVVSLFEPALTRVAPKLYRGLYAVSNTIGTAFVLWAMVFALRDALVYETLSEVLEIPVIWILSVLVVLIVLALIAGLTVFKKGPVGQGSWD